MHSLTLRAVHIFTRFSVYFCASAATSAARAYSTWMYEVPCLSRRLYPPYSDKSSIVPLSALDNFVPHCSTLFLVHLGQEDGYEMQCRWCGVGGDLVGCDRCISSYCESCIQQNLGKKHLQKVKNTNDWGCYSCDPTPTSDLRWDNKKSGTVRAQDTLVSTLSCPIALTVRVAMAGVKKNKRSKRKSTAKIGDQRGRTCTNSSFQVNV